MNFERYPKVKIGISQETYHQKPTSNEIANEVMLYHSGRRWVTQYTNLLDLKRYVEDCRILFPTQIFGDNLLVGDMNLLFFDFDNASFFH